MLHGPRKSLLLAGCLALLCSSCTDHESGYRDGYAGKRAPAWLLLGKEAYLLGYQRGEAQYFQDDWYAENAADIDTALSCPAIVIRAEALNLKEKLGLIPLN